MKIIGLHGKKRHGKDTVADIAGDILDTPYFKVSPGDKLKQLLCEALGIPYASIDEAVAKMDDCKDTWTISVTKPTETGLGYRLNQKVTTITGRQLQQFTGDGARKVFGEDFWIDQVLPPISYHTSEDVDRLNALYPMDDLLIIPSIRYINEAKRVREWGGVVWEVVRPGMPDDDDFISEQRLPDDLIDYTIMNDGDLTDLRLATNSAILETM